MSERLALKTQETNDLKIYSQEEVLKSAIEYFKGDTLAGEVWMKKYALKDAMGNLYEKTPDEMHRRLSSEFARIEAKYPNPLSEQEIYDVIKDFKYIVRSEEHTSELQSRPHLVCRLLLEKKKKKY